MFRNVLHCDCIRLPPCLTLQDLQCYKAPMDDFLLLINTGSGGELNTSLL